MEMIITFDNSKSVTGKQFESEKKIAIEIVKNIASSPNIKFSLITTISKKPKHGNMQKNLFGNVMDIKHQIQEATKSCNLSHFF